ncbi:uncharacterized protein F5Z01DRAFT_329072 [Emericellopsis atlantica]|uniref:Uncharacterized protein n=1 Tax=Emericellopsis atlantica TaxID=2614577 RepID=A0A9P8CL48_9HYPO|nr:uncharacterized protein F5Z01DRAFT_329072 [Emericellopsis atlantica]KAG9251023.1 hypothetical protein F5Z01DRAFT_329072 [Emericellopsis atlantica]
MPAPIAPIAIQVRFMESSGSDFESESNAPTSEINFSAEEAVEDDPFIPSDSEIRRIFNSGRITWSKLAATADQFGDDLWPLDLMRLYVSLDNVPSLPARLPRK